MLELEKSRHLAFKEFIAAHARIMEVVDAELAKANMIPLTWYDVLVTLEYADGHSLRMSELAERVLLSRSGLTRLMDKLVQKGFVVRRTCPTDKRGLHAILTDKGQKVREETWPLFSSLIQEIFGAQMSDEEAGNITTVMNRIATAAMSFRDSVQ